jgi:hypothetical protein
MSIHVDLQSVSAQQQPASTHSRRWVTGALALAGSAVAARGVVRSRAATR